VIFRITNNCIQNDHTNSKYLLFSCFCQLLGFLLIFRSGSFKFLLKREWTFPIELLPLRDVKDWLPLRLSQIWNRLLTLFLEGSAIKLKLRRVDAISDYFTAYGVKLTFYIADIVDQRKFPAFSPRELCLPLAFTLCSNTTSITSIIYVGYKRVKVYDNLIIWDSSVDLKCKLNA
jgi:hypothetical protein